MFIRARAVFVAALVSILPLAPARAADPPALKTLVAAEYAGWDVCLPSEKDAGLRRAISMLPARLRELRQTVPELKQIPEPAIEGLLSLAGRPVRFAVTNKGFDPNTGMPGIGVTVSFRMDDEGGAKAMQDRIEAIRALAGEAAAFTPKPSEKHPGMLDVQLPVGIVSYGPRHAADGWRYEVLYGAVDDADAMFGGLPALTNAPAGFAPAFRGVVDLSAVSPFLQMLGGMAAMGSPQAKAFMEVLSDHGIVGPNAVAIEVVKGYTPDAMVGWMSVKRLGPVAKSAGVIDEAITDADLALVPADATAAHVHRVDLNAWVQKLKADIVKVAGEQAVAEGLAKFTQATGLDLERDIFAPIGKCGAVYLSDSTGGGALTSASMVLRLNDSAKMKASLGSLTSLFNREIRKEVNGPFGVGFASFDRGSASYSQCRFAGLPVPFAPTYSVTGDALVLGGNAQACIAAAEQASRGKGGLADNAAFKSARWKTAGAPTALWFIDSARTLRDGYSLTMLLGTAVENMARSPSSFGGSGTGEREPGTVVPTFSELAAGVKPTLGLGYWMGDDYIVEWRTDRSALVYLTSLFGVGEAASLIEGAVIGGGAASAGRSHEHGHEHKEHGENDEDDENPIPTDDH